MPKHHRTIRRQGKCSCGMRSHNNKKLSQHAKARGHTILQNAESRQGKGD